MADTLFHPIQQARPTAWALDLSDCSFTTSCNDGATRLIERRIKAAGFRDQRTLDAFDWRFNRLTEHSFFDWPNGRFIEQHEDALLLGNAGVGKSHIAQSHRHGRHPRRFASV